MRHSIELDCAPGGVRPNSLFPSIVEGTGLSKKDFELVSKFFGNWKWELIGKKDTIYKKALPSIRRRIKALYNEGSIRYGSW